MSEKADQEPTALERLQDLLHTYRTSFPDTRLNGTELHRADDVLALLQEDTGDTPGPIRASKPEAYGTP